MLLSPQAIVTLVILTAAIVLFLTNRLRADLVALLVLVSLGATNVLTPQETFGGFSRSAVITIVAIFVLAQGLFLTGASERVGDWLVRAAGTSEPRLILIVMLAGAFLTPLGHAVNVLVMGPGGYQFSDYFKVGLPLTVLVSAVVLIVLLLVWPL
jgi:di/tricarboxylate transporter